MNPNRWLHADREESSLIEDDLILEDIISLSRTLDNLEYEFKLAKTKLNMIINNWKQGE